MKNVYIIENFLDTFQLVPPKQQKVWQYLRYFHGKYRNVFPSQKKIAKACGCHRDTVIQAIKKFKELGWLRVIKRAYTSCVYVLLDVLVGIDTRNPEMFRKKNFQSKSDSNPTGNPTIVNINKYKKNDIDMKTELETKIEFKRNVQDLNLSQKLEFKFQTEIIQIVQDLSLSEEDLRILTRLTEKNPNTMQKAIEDFKSLEKKERVKNRAALLTARYKHHSSNAEESEELRTLEVPEKDKKILASYSRKDKKAFRFACEDYKTYSLLKPVKNAAAFITSRFQAYFSGLKEKKIESSGENKVFVQRLSEELKRRKNHHLAFEVLNKNVELLDTRPCPNMQPICLSYEDPDFRQKLEQSLKRWRIRIEASGIALF